MKGVMMLLIRMTVLLKKKISQSMSYTDLYWFGRDELTTLGAATGCWVEGRR